jgi:hypothetical protein
MSSVDFGLFFLLWFEAISERTFTYIQILGLGSRWRWFCSFLVISFFLMPTPGQQHIDGHYASDWDRLQVKVAIRRGVCRFVHFFPFEDL